MRARGRNIVPGIGISPIKPPSLTLAEAHARCEGSRPERRYRDAEESSQAALKEAERCGRRDQRLAVSLNNLAEVYLKQGKYILAEPLYRRSVATWERTLGLDHPAVAVGLNNLALLDAAQGDCAGAESLYQRSRAIWEDALGPDSLYVGISLGNYALLLRQMHREAEAAKMNVRAKAIRGQARWREPGN